ncbi:MAG: arsenate reductase (glutaredoxin) [Wenzhouxiangellaceae bacterium]
MSLTIYHNPRCSKSRATLELLQSHGLEPEIVQYLESPPDAATLEDLARKLGRRPQEFLRTGEQAWKELGLDPDSVSDEELFRLMSEHPIMIERPIVVCADRARIGRPPEAVLEIVPES